MSDPTYTAQPRPQAAARRRPLTGRRGSTVVVAAAALLVGLAAFAPAQAEEGFDLMRQITSQWVKPNVMLVFDRSGSMAYPVDTDHYSSGRWSYRYSDRYHGDLGDDYAGSLYLGADTTDRVSGVYGTGQGYWARIVVLRDSWAGRVYRDNLYRMYVDPGDPGWLTGDEIIIEGMPDSVDNGTFVLTSNPTRDYTAGGTFNYYFTLKKKFSDGTYETSNHEFQRPHHRHDEYSACTMYAAAGSSTKSLWYFVPPSRMAIAKNVLGDTITLYEPSAAPTGIDEYDRDYWVFYGEDGGPTDGAFFDQENDRWQNWTNSSSSAAPVGDSSYTTVVSPSDIVRRFSDVINWGLLSYAGYCVDFNPNQAVVSDDSAQGPVVAAIETKLSFVGTGGLDPSGATPTRAGLASAQTSLATTAASDSRLTCGRSYGVILMTDGQSNNCNNGGSYCWKDPGGNCDGTYPGYDCPTNPQFFPPQKSDSLWNMSASGQNLHTRTWTVGVSTGVGRCELNYTAYKGRTDAASPNGDAGFNTTADPYLPGGSPGTYNTDHGDYAYFSNSVAELREAFIGILSSMGVGDYATASPSVAGGSAASGSLGILGSTEYPSWEGHLRAFDLSKTTTDTDYLVWDAAEVLATGSAAQSPQPNNGLTRRIFTWNPSSNDDLVEITQSNVATLDTICGSCGITPEVVDFIRGGNGNVDTSTDPPTPGSLRPMLLGALINSTPAIVGPPASWEQNTLYEHSSFQNEYGTRHRMVWVGTSDGMVRAFDIIDGAEVLALVPPDLLDNQVTLYNNYAEKPISRPLGQTGLPSDHVYGVANSIRFADVYFPGVSGTPGEYKTVMYVTEGPGGSGLHAIDVTHAYPGRTIDGQTYDPDPSFGYVQDGTDPVHVLWSVTADGEAGTTAVAALGDTWSVPSVAATANTSWMLEIGAGYKDNTGNTITPKTLFFDPTTGAPVNGTSTNSTTTATNSSTRYVGNQTFADSVLWKNSSGIFAEDNVAGEGVQADLNGHLWRITKGSSMSASNLVTLSTAEPLYYPPAVAGYPAAPVTYSLYAYSSGSFFEKSTMVNGPNTGNSGYFIPAIHIAARTLSDGSVSHASVPLKNIPIDDQGHTLGRRSQVTAPPMLFTPRQGVDAKPFALYLIYDPDGSACVGLSYIVRINFDPANLNLLQSDLGSGDKVEVYEAGEGTSGGFALAGEKVLVAQSDVGENPEAGLVEVPNLAIPQGGGNRNVNWWVELQ